MHKYEIILYWSEEDNAYIAEVPELAGCMADGATAKDALRNVERDIVQMFTRMQSFIMEVLLTTAL